MTPISSPSLSIGTAESRSGNCRAFEYSLTRELRIGKNLGNVNDLAFERPRAP